jgi:hypothetical protein
MLTLRLFLERYEQYVARLMYIYTKIKNNIKNTVAWLQVIFNPTVQ